LAATLDAEDGPPIINLPSFVAADAYPRVRRDRRRPVSRLIKNSGPPLPEAMGGPLFAGAF